MQYEAELKNNEIKIKANVERKANGDLIINVPSFPVIAKTIKEFKEKQKPIKEEKVK